MAQMTLRASFGPILFIAGPQNPIHDFKTCKINVISIKESKRKRKKNHEWPKQHYTWCLGPFASSPALQTP